MRAYRAVPTIRYGTVPASLVIRGGCGNVPLERFLAQLLLAFLSPLEGLNVGLVVGPDPVPDGRKGAVVEELRVAGRGGVFQELGRQAVVVVALLDRVVAGREGEILLPVGNQKLFQFRIRLPRKLLAGGGWGVLR